MNEEELRNFIKTELQGNLMVLIDPKRTDSLSQDRINVWKNLVTDRLCYYLIEKGYLKQ